MDYTVSDWVLNLAPLPLIGLGIFLLLTAAAGIGALVRRRHRAKDGQDDEEANSQEGYVVSAVLGLLALLLGFTFALAVDRFDTRRSLVLQEANAIGTTYLRAQLLDEPHRSRLSALIVRYVDNRLAVSHATTPEETTRLLAVTDALQTRLWAATVAAVKPTPDSEIAASFVETMNETIDLAAARKIARRAHVPTRVHEMLLIYMMISAGVLGYVVDGRRRLPGGLLLALLTMSMMLIIDIDRPTRGGITVSQRPMEELKASIAAQPPAVFDAR